MKPGRDRAWLMRHAYILLVVVLIVFYVVIFLISELLYIPLLIDPLPALRNAGPLAAAGSVGLLIADVVLPMPASAVMIANGALFGLFPGMALSMIGGLGATLLGFLIGRRSRDLFLPGATSGTEQRANALLARYGPLAIVVTRPLPIVAETVAILAGRSDLSWRQVFVAGAVGTLIPAALYAFAGATAATTVSTIAVIGAALIASAVFWLAIRGATIPATEAEGSPPDDGARQDDAGFRVPPKG